MPRNIASITEKAKTHSVYPISQGFYKVVSGSSDNFYAVTNNDGKFACTCDWAIKREHPEGEVVCSHVAAVVSYLASLDNRKVKLADPAESSRLHLRRELSADGVAIHSRKVA